MSMESRDESVHEYPRPLNQPWKENWYFNFIDQKANAWGINHFSLMRHKQKGRFSAFHVVDGEVLLYTNEIAIDDNLRELTDGRLKAEFIEPFARFRLTFTGERHRVELDYTARFPIFDYAMAARPGRNKDRATTLEHYEQALVCRGRIEKDGRSREIDCLGHRDHSWGYRNESKIGGWNWVAIQFPERTVNLYRAVIGKAFIGSGFISSASGNARITRMNIDRTDFDGKEPLSSTFTAHDEAGAVHHFRSSRFSHLFLPMTEKGGGVYVYENFSDFTDLDSGAAGVGIDEYLINPAIG
jgi:hypothetical protein